MLEPLQRKLMLAVNFRAAGDCPADHRVGGRTRHRSGRVAAVISRIPAQRQGDARRESRCTRSAARATTCASARQPGSTPPRRCTQLFTAGAYQTAPGAGIDYTRSGAARFSAPWRRARSARRNAVCSRGHIFAAICRTSPFSPSTCVPGFYAACASSAACGSCRLRDAAARAITHSSAPG